ncbi:MarR family winged helix-turn-helix transcriptional regulator [Austwickia chelonae]|uniref:MarR family winged helix-turn-helix transcriptional regulator n=1 Tax=Austwickia chelonae TaxID=100225 RepID=UPI000E26A110|nr:MarR family winged helix-turn-helix transcriptional regulator [Austwickia chelonae]
MTTSPRPGNTTGHPTTEKTSPEPRWLTAHEQRIWRSWLTATKGLQSTLGSDLINESGLSMPDYEVLVVLSEAPDETSRVSALADLTGWERSRLSHHLGRMEKRKLIQRRCCPEDARGQLVSLTDTGRERIRESAPGHVAAVRRHLFDILDSDDLAALERITARIIDSLPDQG